MTNELGPLPDRVATDKRSHFYDKRWPMIEVLFKGNRCPDNVLEYCVSEGWIIIKHGPEGTRHKQLFGTVETRWRSQAPTAPTKRVERPSTSDLDVQAQAAAKRLRKAAKLAQLKRNFEGNK